MTDPVPSKERSLDERLAEACEGKFSGPDAWRLFLDLRVELTALRGNQADTASTGAGVTAPTPRGSVSNSLGSPSDETPQPASKSRAECSHEKLRFGSGDYYIFCANLDCGAQWAAIGGGQPEYGFDITGRPIGCNALVSNKGVGGTLSGQERHSLCDDCPPEGYPTDKTRCAPCPRRTDETGAQVCPTCKGHFFPEKGGNPCHAGWPAAEPPPEGWPEGVFVPSEKAAVPPLPCIYRTGCIDTERCIRAGHCDGPGIPPPSKAAAARYKPGDPVDCIYCGNLRGDAHADDCPRKSSDRPHDWRADDEGGLPVNGPEQRK